ncbi:MAG TPA: prepilin-type N-terminal cleavage/methylation domain-containing protein [Tepidisphaeraceae bacterium]|jgi:prepilin-type N-terminal cleavage/methylation domain-containing protein/prepilin-type processing-associated H-X9-DG protein
MNQALVARKKIFLKKLFLVVPYWPVGQFAGLSSRRKAFTLVELMVVIGIIALLIAILLPVVTMARIRGKELICQSNVHQICSCLFLYTGDYLVFPPNESVPSPSGQWWYDDYHVGKMLGKYGTTLNSYQPSLTSPDPTLICPMDNSLSLRSYAMNVWASCQIDSSILNTHAGVLWGPGTKHAEQLILVTEKWASTGSNKFGWTASPTIGGTVTATPGELFGGGTGLPVKVSAGSLGLASTELPYMRHRLYQGPGHGLDAVGRVTIGYADGHVAIKSNTELYDSSGKSMLRTLWSPADPLLNN